MLSITSTIQSKLLYDQSFVLGLRPQRFWIVWGLLYFPIRKLMYNRIISVDDIIKLIYVIGTIEIILYSLQYFVGKGHQFLYTMTAQRYGSDRYYFSNIFLRVLLFINLDRIFSRKKIGWSAAYIISIIFILMVVGKMRATSLATILALAIGILLWRKGGQTKLIVLMVSVVVAIALFNTSIVQDIIVEIGAYLDGNPFANSTLNIRDAGHELYLQTLYKHPLLGGGTINSLWPAACEAAGFNRAILLVDNGLWGFIFVYGILGAVWVIGMFFTFLKNGWKIARNNNVFFMFLAPLGWLIAGQSEAAWYWENGGFICVTILLTVMEEYLRYTPEKVSSIIESR
jgi:hypothetical protein